MGGREKGGKVSVRTEKGEERDGQGQQEKERRGRVNITHLKIVCFV